MALSRITNPFLSTNGSLTNIKSPSANTITANTSGNQAWIVDSNGRMAIANTSTFSTSRFHVISPYKSQYAFSMDTQSEAYSSSNGLNNPYTVSGLVAHIGNSNLLNDAAALIGFDMQDGSSNNCGAYFGGLTNNGVVNGAANMVFGRRTGTSTFAESARFNPSGYLGIATTNPRAQIHTATTGIIGQQKFLNAVAATRTNSGDTRNITVASIGGEYYLEMFIVGLWPYSGSGYGVRKLEITGYANENRYTVITNSGSAGGANPTVTVSASGGNVIVQLVYGSVYRFTAITRLVYGSDDAYVTIDGTNT